MYETRILNIDGLEFDIKPVAVKPRLSREISAGGRMAASVPKDFSDEQIREFVRANWESVKKTLDEYAHSINGRNCWVWGKKYFLKLQFVSVGQIGLKLENEQLVLKVKSGTSVKNQAAALESGLRKLLHEAVVRLLPECEEALGVKPNEWHIKKMRTRWGTCNSRDKRLWLNSLLVSRDRECLRYIIVHELAHIFERLHNRAFWQHVERAMPDWREAKSRLAQPLK